METLTNIIDSLRVIEKPQPYHLIFSYDVWKKYQGAGVPCVDYTDEELMDYDRETGIIGEKQGIIAIMQQKL